jgi:cytoplasmic iron level regulating protein YaaA (DUF328/UPF0246 family)
VLVLLPPSETKRDGGDGPPLVPDGLSYPKLATPRSAVLEATLGLAADSDGMMRALKLGSRQSAEVERNRRLLDSPTMPAIDRYTGVLYDALDARTLDSRSRAHAARHVVVHSALFGLVGAGDGIPAYRLSHDSRLPGPPLRRVWRDAVAAELDAVDGLIVDLRSEGYVHLGPAPIRRDAVFLRVVSIDEHGRRRALNHFNKRTKGLFTRALLEDRAELRGRDDLIAWAREHGFGLAHGAPDTPSNELELVV